MKKKNKEKLWGRINQKIQKITQDLKEDSVAANPRKPVDCCNPPVPEREGSPDSAGKNPH